MDNWMMGNYGSKLELHIYCQTHNQSIKAFILYYLKHHQQRAEFEATYQTNHGAIYWRWS